MTSESQVPANRERTRFNTYVSGRRLRRLPPTAELVANGVTHTAEFEMYLDQDPITPAMIFALGDELVWFDLVRFINGVLGASHNDRDIWGPLVQDPDKAGLWGNNQVSVNVRSAQNEQGKTYWELSYRRRDRAPIHDWRVSQRIKNEICGPEAEGIELYPAESRLLDTANEYWIYAFEAGSVMTDLLQKFGNDMRTVLTQAELDATPPYIDAVQRDPDE